MSDKKNNQGQQKPQERPYLEHGGYQKRSHPEGRTTTTSQKPAPGHKGDKK